MTGRDTASESSEASQHVTTRRATGLLDTRQAGTDGANVVPFLARTRDGRGSGQG